MEKLPRTRLLEHHGGRHFLSEPHMRIQVLPVPFGPRNGEPLFASYHGEVLIQCIDGRCVVVTKSERCPLAEGDEVVLVNGEPFRVDRADGEGSEAVVQLVWAPGPNPCRACWELDSRFFAPGGG
jgi:hypothetical protein